MKKKTELLEMRFSLITMITLLQNGKHLRLVY